MLPLLILKKKWAMNLKIIMDRSFVIMKKSVMCN